MSRGLCASIISLVALWGSFSPQTKSWLVQVGRIFMMELMLYLAAHNCVGEVQSLAARVVDSFGVEGVFCAKLLSEMLATAPKLEGGLTSCGSSVISKSLFKFLFRTVRKLVSHGVLSCPFQLDPRVAHTSPPHPLASPRPQ